MKVNAGSKIRNLMGFAMKKMKEPGLTQITWNSSGAGITKAISCAEVMKRKIKDLHQITRIRYMRIEEYWEPKMEGLERLKVNRDTPAITILLSKSPLGTNEPGYQPPGSFEAFWQAGQKSRSDKRKSVGRTRKQQSSNNPNLNGDARKRTKRERDKKNSAEKDAKNKSNLEDSKKMETEMS